MCKLCPFETEEHKQVASHYNDHGLPKITLLKETESSGAVKMNLPEKTMLVRCIDKR